MKFIFIVFPLLASAFAVPTSSGGSSCQKITSNYDDIPASILLPQFNDISTYQGLNYSGFKIAMRTRLPGSKAPESASNALVASQVTNLLTLGELSLYPFGVITPGPGTKSFDIESFYYAVDIDLHQSLAAVKIGADLVVYGTYAANGQQTPITSLTYSPEGVLNAKMMQTTGLDDFKGLSSFTIALKTANGLIGLVKSQGVVLVDDLTHRNCE